MKAEIVSTGDEVIKGAVIDSNSAYIAKNLDNAGVVITRHNSVSDDVTAMVSLFSEVSQRSDIAIVSGGLGPTADDLTALAAANAACVPLILDPNAQTSMTNFFKQHNLPVVGSNKKQAMLPEGSRCLVNPVGTAPGFMLTIKSCLFFFLPGVPHEMRFMLQEHVLPEIEKKLNRSKQCNITRTLSVFGLTESKVNDYLNGFTDALPDIKLGLQADFPLIFIKLYARGPNAAELERHLDGAVKKLNDRMGQWIFSCSGQTLEQRIGTLLTEKKATLSIAESCTGGLIANLLTDVAGSSTYFMFSGVTYSNKAKLDVLNVHPETLQQYGAVHEKTAAEMAKGAQKLGHSDYAISTSGIAGPDGGTPEKPVGTVCIGIATPHGTKAYRFTFPFRSRDANKRIFAAMALSVLEKELTKRRSA